jgi:hypothetical protein
MGTEGSSQGGKAAGRDADHSLPSSAEIKNDGAIHSLPIRLHGAVLNQLSTGAKLSLPLLFLIGIHTTTGVWPRMGAQWNPEWP